MSAVATPIIAADQERIMHLGAVQGRFYLERWYETDRHSYLPNCSTRSISPEQVVFIAQEQVNIEDRAFIYLPRVGLVRGKVSRTIGPVIYMDITATDDERNRFSTAILWLDRSSRFSLNDRRAFPRYVPKNPASAFGVPGNKKRMPCTIANISPTGALVMSQLRPPLGTKVILGEVHGSIARHHEFGFGVAFATIQDPAFLEHLLAVEDSEILHLRETAIVLEDRPA